MSESDGIESLPSWSESPVGIKGSLVIDTLEDEGADIRVSFFFCPSSKSC
jgi:hypothetical protein